MKYLIGVGIVLNKEETTVVKPTKQDEVTPELRLSEDAEALIVNYQSLIDNLIEENKKLRRANSRLKNERRRLFRKIQDMVEKSTSSKSNRTPNKSYKNGKRGSKFNG